jgi:hypothetical protein
MFGNTSEHLRHRGANLAATARAGIKPLSLNENTGMGNTKPGCAVDKSGGTSNHC